VDSHSRSITALTISGGILARALIPYGVQDGCVRANTDGKRKDDDERQSGILAEQKKSVAEILGEQAHGVLLGRVIVLDGTVERALGHYENTSICI